MISLTYLIMKRFLTCSLAGLLLVIFGCNTPVAKFYADRPFIYAITEVSTGAIIFMGQYTGK